MSWRDSRRKLSCLYIGLMANPLHLSWPRIQKRKQCCDLFTWLTQIFCLLNSVCLLDCPSSLALPLRCTCSPTYPSLVTRSILWTLSSSCFLCSNHQLGDPLHLMISSAILFRRSSRVQVLILSDHPNHPWIVLQSSLTYPNHPPVVS